MLAIETKLSLIAIWFPHFDLYSSSVLNKILPPIIHRKLKDTTIKNMIGNNKYLPQYYLLSVSIFILFYYFL